MDEHKKKLARSLGLTALALAASVLLGCGQKGPLVLPKAPAQAKAPMNSPAPAASAVPAKD